MTLNYFEPALKMIRRLTLHLLANAIALYFISQLLNGDFAVTGGWQGYLLAAFIFGFLNSLVKPILKILSLPVMVITAGLFSLILNILILWLAQYFLGVLAFENISIYVEHIAAYFYAGLLIAMANSVIHWLTRK